ncbi:uncharacterized protein LOC116247612 isoform X2 [Nymphaea colorata]|uniref:uncharacterized protein LOC116247612 isoform X2 n=1 Tax=Nymphaea colorata TaxID=210225 RepID=UPI00129EAB02|nr:uncharacterized protein LOC116247612 isoform X2 [Nymphaea colorata]
MTEHSLWSHLPLLVRSNSKDSVEFILQTLWKTRKTGLDPYDRETIRGVLQLSNDAELDPLLVCLRTLIRKCVHGNCKRDEVQNLFPPEVSPEIRRLLTILLQKFQIEWQEDARDDKVSLPRLKAMSWNMANQNDERVDHAAIINLKLQDDTQSVSGEVNVNFQITKDTLETMLKSMYYIRDQLSNVVSHWVRHQADSYRPMDSRKMFEDLLVRQSLCHLNVILNLDPVIYPQWSCLKARAPTQNPSLPAGCVLHTIKSVIQRVRLPC